MFILAIISLVLNFEIVVTLIHELQNYKLIGEPFDFLKLRN